MDGVSVIYHVELYSKGDGEYYTDSTHRSKYNADTRCRELNWRGQFARVVDGRGEICTW